MEDPLILVRYIIWSWLPDKKCWEAVDSKYTEPEAIKAVHVRSMWAKKFRIVEASFCYKPEGLKPTVDDWVTVES